MHIRTISSTRLWQLLTTTTVFWLLLLIGTHKNVPNMSRCTVQKKTLHILANRGQLSTSRRTVHTSTTTLILHKLDSNTRPEESLTDKHICTTRQSSTFAANNLRYWYHCLNKYRRRHLQQSVREVSKVTLSGEGRYGRQWLQIISLKAAVKTDKMETTRNRITL